MTCTEKTFLYLQYQQTFPYAGVLKQPVVFLLLNCHVMGCLLYGSAPVCKVVLLQLLVYAAVMEEK